MVGTRTRIAEEETILRRYWARSVGFVAKDKSFGGRLMDGFAVLWWSMADV